MLTFVFSMFRSKRFLICFGVILLLFLPVFRSFDFNLFLSVILLIVIFILSLAATAVVNAVRSVSHAAVSYSRAAKLAEEFPQAAEIEKQRGHLIVLRLVFVVAAAALIILGILVAEQAGAFIGGIIAVLFYVLVVLKKEIAVRDSFKQLTMLDALSKAFENIEFDAHKCFPQQELFDLNLIQGFDTMSGNDWIRAERKGVPFCRSDVLIQEEHTREDSEGNETTTYVTTFEGSVMRFEQQQDYPTRLVVITEGFPNVRSLSESFKKLTGRVSDSSVETELDEFNRLFDAYSSDQVASRMILTPQMIEGMLRLKRYANYQLAFVFEGKFLYLFVSMPGVDSFELSVSSGKSVQDQQKTVNEQVGQIAGLIDNMYFKDAARV
ncbi:DUF3137 domain-containing protein [Caproiciproducens sp.]